MKISPYLSFNGNCAEAIALYEKAFDTKANVLLYKDSPPEMGMTEFGDQVFDAQLKLGSETIMFHDLMPGTPAAQIGSNFMLTIKFDEIDEPKIKKAFSILQEGGEVVMELCAVPWSKCFGLVADKFGITWNFCQN